MAEARRFGDLMADAQVEFDALVGPEVPGEGPVARAARWMSALAARRESGREDGAAGDGDGVDAQPGDGVAEGTGAPERPWERGQLRW